MHKFMLYRCHNRCCLPLLARNFNVEGVSSMTPSELAAMIQQSQREGLASLKDMMREELQLTADQAIDRGPRFSAGLMRGQLQPEALGDYAVGCKPLKSTYMKWYEGDCDRGVPPFRSLKTEHFSGKSRGQFKKLRTMMKHVERRAVGLGLDPANPQFDHRGAYEELENAVFQDCYGHMLEQARRGEIQISTLLNRLVKRKVIGNKQ